MFYCEFFLRLFSVLGH